MPRGKNLNKTRKVQPTLSVQQIDYLEQLVDMGNLGNTPTAVALSLISRSIDQYILAGIIKNRRSGKKKLSKE